MQLPTSFIASRSFPFPRDFSNLANLPQIIRGRDRDDYWTWTRWGRVGTAGNDMICGNGTLQNALELFGQKFKDRSPALNGLTEEKTQSLTNMCSRHRVH